MFLTQFLCQALYTQRPEGTQVIVGLMNMGYISDTARNRTHNRFRPKREPIPLGHNDGHYSAHTKGVKQSFPIIIFSPKRAMHGLMPPPKYATDDYKNWETQRSSEHGDIQDDSLGFLIYK